MIIHLSGKQTGEKDIFLVTNSDDLMRQDNLIIQPRILLRYYIFNLKTNQWVLLERKESLYRVTGSGKGNNLKSTFKNYYTIVPWNVITILWNDTDINEIKKTGAVKYCTFSL